MNPNKITSEIVLEKNLMANLENLGYMSRLDIKTDKDIEANIKLHMERLNNVLLTKEEFETYVLKVIQNLTVFEAAKKFRDKFVIKRGTHDNLRLSCIDENNEKNIFEYSHQIKSKSDYKNIGDISIFMNGFPICQIELKRVDVEINQAYNQIMRYKYENFDKNIFKFIQIYIISNDLFTKYFANHNGSFKLNNSFMFFWSDSENKCYTGLEEFSKSFLNKKTIFKLITKYTVFREATKEIVILRPYQYHAIESIINKINSTNKLNNEIKDLYERAKKLNGFIFHATGSGKTLTSFKTFQILSKELNCNKVIFLVDRLDLNSQTMEEFKKYSNDELDQTESSSHLEKQLKDPNIPLIVTTIQKISRLLKKNNELYRKQNSDITNSNIIFIIDECHRTQFGDMHKIIRKTFLKSRLIGFTGTPIFSASSHNMQTTSDIFGEELHRYMMANAISDGNVLGFQVEYASGPRGKMSCGDDIDKEVESIDKKEFFSSDKYIDKIVDFIALNNQKKTLGEMKSMLTTSSIKNAIKYYKSFRSRHPKFKIATLFSYIDNDENIAINQHSKHELEKIIKDYNSLYKKDYSTNRFKEYSRSIQNDLKNEFGEIELIIVVEMLTTGFDCKDINTIYLDKELKTHKLIQTISRANRVYKPNKRFANIISFRTFKKDFDYAVGLYNDSQTVGYVEKETLENFVIKVNDEIKKLKTKWPVPGDIINLTSEIKKEFILSIRSINRLLTIVLTYINFDFKDVLITREEWEKYKQVQKYIAEQVNFNLSKDSILDNIDFELDFTVDKIDVDYILSLANEIKINSKNFDDQISEIMEKIQKISLKPKRLLLESFIREWIIKMKSQEHNLWKENEVPENFADHKIKNIIPIIDDYAIEHNLDSEKLKFIIKKYQFEDKNINSYLSEVRDCIIEEMGLLSKNKLIENINLFILKTKDIYSLDTDDKNINGEKNE